MEQAPLAVEALPTCVPVVMIGDRLDITGAVVVLKLRALNDNGDFDEYWTFHLAAEHERLYPTPNQHNYQLTA
ncbi:hypothetical protein M2158_004171 [Streptomyces sp. SAI-144]|nr:hypothetical protein [Streptomyces sp. SAI-144]